MADTVSSREERLVTGIGAVRRQDVEFAGGKGANLGELMHAGFPVPDGFIVSTEAYATVVEEVGLAAVISDGLAAGDDGATIRAAFEEGTAPRRSGRRDRQGVRRPRRWTGCGPLQRDHRGSREGCVCGPAGHLP